MLFVRAVSRTTSKSSAGGVQLLRTLHNTPYRKDHFLNATADVFQQRIAQKDRLVLVDFYANWCGPCHTLSPILTKLTSELKTKDGNPIDLVSLDIEADDNVPLGMKYKIRALPTVIAFKDGQEIDQFVGALPESQVRDFIAKQ